MSSKYRRCCALLLAVTAVLTIVAGPPAQAVPPLLAGLIGVPDDEPGAAPSTIRFNFKGASFQQVVDFFSRTTGLPVVWEVDPPEGTLDYLSQESYDLPGALRVLNIILQSKGVMLRHDDDMLYLQALTEMQRENIPTFIGAIDEDLTDDQIVTVVRPLSIAVASTLAEHLQKMIASYGSVTALRQQNALVITETVSQIKRLNRIIDELDREDNEGVIEIIPIRHARAVQIMEPLKALLTTRVEKYVINQKGKQVKIEEDSMPGLNITVDERTNSLIAKGVKSRIDKLKEAISLLDVPATAGSRVVRTFQLETIAPSAAVKTLKQVFASREDKLKPIVLPFDDTSRLTVVGPSDAITEAAEILREIDGGNLAADSAGTSISAIALENASVDAIIKAVRGLLSPRQQKTLKLVAGADRRTLIVSGPSRDVASVESIVPVLDRPGQIDREMRIVRLTAADPAAVIERARELYRRQVEAEGNEADDRWRFEGEFDAETRLFTMIGSAAALDRYQMAMRTVESNVVIDRETRQLVVTNARPSLVAVPLATLARQVLDSRDGTTFVAPQVEAVDELDLLIVTAPSEQFAVILSLLATLDRADPAAFTFRTIPLTGLTEVDALLDRASDIFGRLAAGYGENERPAPKLEHDLTSGYLLVSGQNESVQLFERALSEARRLLPPAREGRMISLTQADATDVAVPLVDLIAKLTPAAGARRITPPTIEVVTRTNSLYVVAEPAQHTMVQRLIRELDTIEPTDLPPLKLLQVRAADAAQLSTMLRRRYEARPADQRREQPVSIDADAATNTLIVTAHADVFDEIREFVESVNRADSEGADRETIIFPLKRARAQDLASALEKLYPEPPMPLDRRGRPMPHLRQPREVYVSADIGTNTLIIEAPAERKESFEALVNQLDRVELPPRATLRTYRIERGDPALIARTLTELARRGVMTEQPTDGSKPVDVLIQAEPASRTLIVAGDEVTFAQTESMLKDLSIVPVQRSLRIFDVTGADLETFAAQAQRLYADQTAEIPDAQPVSVELDRTSGTLLVVAENEAMMRFAAILDQLQQTVGPPPDVQLIPLEYADATDVVAWLTDLAGSHLAMVGERGGSTPVFEVIERTNSILIAAQREQQAIIRSLISELDRMEPKEMPPLRILQLRSADAANLARALTQQYNLRSADERNEKPVRIVADVQTNALMVAAHPDMMPEIQAIVQELNVTNRLDTEGREIRIFPLKVARAEDLAKTLDEMFPEPPVPVDRRGRPMPQLREPREVVVRADPQTNSIIVDAPVQRMAGFDQLVEQLDRARITEETEIRTYEIVHAELDAVARTLRELASGGALSTTGQDRRAPILVSTEIASRRLIISGPAEVFPQVEALLKDMDVRHRGPATSLRFYKLEHARADSLAAMLRQVLTTRLLEDVPDAGAEAQGLLEVTADQKTNTIIISAPEALQKVAEQLIQQLDSGTAAIGDPIVRVRPLTFADAGAVSTSLAAALPAMLSTVTGEPMSIKLIPAPGSNALILVGHAPDLDEIETLIQPLDARPAMDAMDARTFRLEYADAAQIAGIVQNLLADQMASDPRLIMERIRRSRGQLDLTPKIRVEAEARTNSLIVSGPQQTVSLAESMIEQLDRPDEMGERIVRVFTPANGVPADLVASVDRLLSMTDDRARGRGVQLVAEPQSGAVVIVGTEEEVARAEELLAKRDAATLRAPAMDLRVLTLVHTDAATIARTVGSLLADRTRWPESLRAMARAGLTIGQPTVTADAQGNRLLVSAPTSLMPLASSLLAQLDQPASDAGAMDVRIFTLQRAEAAAVASSLGTALTEEAARMPGTPAPSVVAESSSNSVIVTATGDVLDRVASMISTIDQGSKPDQAQVRTVFLKHARAEVIAPIVSQLFSGEETPAWMRIDIRRLRSRGVDIEEDTPFRVAADQRLNAIVLSAPPSVLTVAEEMVHQLDTMPDADPNARRRVHVLSVVNADATELAASIEVLFGDADDGESAPTIRVDAASNSLLVRATTSQFERIAAVVEQIDSATIATARQLRMIPIDPSRATAAEVARTLEKMLQRGSGSTVEVITLEQLLQERRTGSAGTDETKDADADPAEEEDAPNDADAPADVPEGNPSAAATSSGMVGYGWSMLGAAVFAADPEVASEAGPPAVTIAVDPATNSLVVVGAPRQIERVAELVRQVQEQLPVEPGRVRYIALPSDINASTLTTMITQTLAKLTPAGGRRGDLARRVSVIADPGGSALIVTAGESDFKTIGDLIAALAQPPATDEVVVKIYPLETMTADRAASSLQQLVSPPATNQRRRGDRQAQRMRSLAIKLMHGEESFAAVFNPQRVTVSADSDSNTLVVMAPADAIDFIDQYIEMLDQTPIAVRATLKLFPLENARAKDLEGILRNIFRARFKARSNNRGGGMAAIQPQFQTDERTNMLLVTAAPEDLTDVAGLLETLDQPLGEDRHPLRLIELDGARPSEIARTIEDAIIGTDQERRTSTLIVPEDHSGFLLVRASEEVNAEIDDLIERMDRGTNDRFPVRTIVLERADAAAVASSLQQFFEDRARVASEGRGRRSRNRTVSIIGQSASKTLLIAANDKDFVEIERLVAQFDSAEATDAWEFRMFHLEHAKAGDIANTITQMVQDLTWNQPFMFFGNRGGQSSHGTMSVRADERLNALIVTGEGDKFDLVEQLIAVLDAPESDDATRLVRFYTIRNVDPQLMLRVINDLYADASGQQRWWEPADPNGVKIQYDAKSGMLVVAASAKEQTEIAGLIDEISGQVPATDARIVVLPVEYALPEDLARTLRSFLTDRARLAGEPAPAVTIAASRSASSLVVAADAPTLATIRDLLGQLDQPDVSGDRVIEIIVLRESDAGDIATIVREQFSRRNGQSVLVTADLRTNSLVINGPKSAFAQAKALIMQLDARDQADEAIIRTFPLTGAQAADAVRILSETLQLDSRGETRGMLVKLDDDANAVEVSARITADPRSNSVIVTATAASLPVIEALIRQIDDVPAVSVVEYHILTLEHAMADDVSMTLGMIGNWGKGNEKPRFDYNQKENQLIVSATADQYEQIKAMIDEIDTPSARERITEFVPLQFAEAEQVREALSFFYGPFAVAADTPGQRNVRLVADPATNSLVVSAEADEWANIRALLKELDSEEYDASLQLQVIALTYADATAVARAVNDVFQTKVSGRGERGGNRNNERNEGGDSGGGDRREPDAPSVLVEADEWVRASAERMTNSLIVSANRQNMKKIELIVTQIDQPDFAKMPAPRIIPVTSGDPMQLAEELATLYTQEEGGRGRQSLRIVGSEATNTIIVRAEDDEFLQIRTLAEALQQEASGRGLAVRVIRLTSAPARRVAEAIQDAYAEKAKQLNQPLSIEVDSAGNALIVAAGGPLFEEIEATAHELDALSPAAGQGIFIIELENIAPDRAIEIIRTIGLDQEPSESTRRLVAEPITVSVLPGRNALVIVANPADREVVVGLLKGLDAEPELAIGHTQIVRLEHARAGALMNILEQVLRPGDQQSGTPLAEAVKEQVRRLQLQRDGVDDPDIDLDLTQPIRLVADDGSNTLLISSSEGNVAALVALVDLFDELPITDAATVQLFPLNNIAADQFVRIVQDLFAQGKKLGNVPGSDVRGVPAGMVGRALLDEVAIAVDERTNTVIVAGKEEAVALVEVLTLRLDSEVAAGWVEPRVVPLKYADAIDLADTLRAILVEGTNNLPQSNPLQRQIGRLRMAKGEQGRGGVLQADVFQPMSRLVIRPEPQLNALLLVGTPANLEVVGELVTMLDVEAASPDASVRIYPIEFASAAKLQNTITRLFDQQVRSKAIRAEDRVVAQSDERTNALIVTTSPRSFAVLESLLRSLDSELAPDFQEIRRIELENASATRLASMIQSLMDARVERLRKIQPETAELDRVSIEPDVRTNSLVIAAGNESWEVVRRLAEELDRSTLDDPALVRVIALESANADRISDLITTIMERRYAELPADLRNAQMPLVLTDLRSNSLLVAANPEDFKSIEELVERLEATPSDPAVAVQIVALPPAASATQLAPRIQRLMRDRERSLGDSGRPSDRVTVEADEQSNTLIVAASREHLEVVEGLVEMLVAAGEDAIAGRAYEIIPITTSRASDVVSLVEDLYVDEARRTRGQGAVQISADERTNSLVIKGGDEDIEAIRDLVAQLDGTQPAQVVEIRYLPLKSANSVETVSLIENVLNGRGLGGRRGARQATVLKYLQELDGVVGGPEMEVSAAIRESIVLTPDVRTNTIIVTAPAQSMEMIVRMVKDLDESSVGSKNIRIFNLTNADAIAMAEVLSDLFNLRQGRNLFVLKPREDVAPAIGGEGGGLSGGLAGADLTAVPDERQQLSITVDSRTNSLLVSGTPTYLDLVEQVVMELDALEANERETFVYPLRNATAESVADVIGEFVRLEQEKLVGTLTDDQLGSAARLLEREITIQGDAQSNSVLVSASPRYVERVRDMINQLDVDPPQVLIQVMLAEITLDGGEEYGVDLTVRGQHDNTSIAAGFGLASAFVGGMGVPTLTVAATDFDLVIKALQTQGRVHVLSNPSVMAANNEPAELQVGQTIRVPDSSQFTDGGNTNTSTTEQELGVKLNVTPSINPDGYVRMTVEPEISNLTTQTTQISEGLESPVINVRRASTTVTVRDGQTIVIGGLISDRYEHRIRKVPFFGDLPLIGALFRSETTESSKTELLIVLTPHVIQSPTDHQRVDELTWGEVDRLTLPESLKARIRAGEFDLGDGLFDSKGNPIDVKEMARDAEEDEANADQSETPVEPEKDKQE